MFIVTLNSFYGPALEGSQPMHIFGPFETMDQAEEVEENINEMLEEMGQQEILAQAFEVDGKDFPKSTDELRDLLGLEEDELEFDEGY